VSRWVHDHYETLHDLGVDPAAQQSMSPRQSGSRVSRQVRFRSPKPRKELGQHFLVDPDALHRIAAAAELHAGDSVLEIGAGTGLLTAALAETGARIAAVELDENLSRLLRDRFAAIPSIKVVGANVLDHQPRELLLEAGLHPPYTVVANIPYYITAPILRHLLEAEIPPRRMILTVQREVAETITARAGALSLLAVSVQFYATPSLLFRLPSSAFRPSPKVESAVVRIDVADEPKLKVDDREAYFEVVRAGFRSPRKQLHNALSRGLWLPPDESVPLLKAAGIEPERRAQTLTLEEWKQVYCAYQERRRSWGPNPGAEPKPVG
jgi:16S rRNA (adenine1518-N6/adenine1519-N6)-dimethyltransferase